VAGRRQFGQDRGERGGKGQASSLSGGKDDLVVKGIFRFTFSWQKTIERKERKAKKIIKGMIKVRRQGGAGSVQGGGDPAYFGIVEKAPEMATLYSGKKVSVVQRKRDHETKLKTVL